MALEHFASILADAGKILKISLPCNDNKGCLIKFSSGLEVQIEADFSSTPRIIIGAALGSPTPGFYRENVFREALKSNGQVSSRHGIFAYSPKKDALFLYAQLPFEETSGQRLAEVLAPFIQKAESWKSTLDRNQTPTFTEGEGAARAPSGGLFGVR
jgi:hypothetical protein